MSESSFSNRDPISKYSVEYKDQHLSLDEIYRRHAAYPAGALAVGAQYHHYDPSMRTIPLALAQEVHGNASNNRSNERWDPRAHQQQNDFTTNASPLQMTGSSGSLRAVKQWARKNILWLILVVVIALGLLLPLFGMSVIAILIVERLRTKLALP